MQIYLAPMEGITNYIYRDTFRRYYGGIDKYFTPFLTSENLSSKDIAEVLPAHNEGAYLVPQILTNHPHTFLAIAGHLKDYGYTEVNLNLGCPSGTVVGKKRGAGFLGVPDALDAFLKEIFEKSPLEISIKTRLGLYSLDEWERILAIYAKYPIKELIIHTRLRTEMYQGETHPEAFRQAYEVLSCPLCYNGDIRDEASLLKVTQSLLFQPDTIMIGRGAIANPSLASAIKEKSFAVAKDFKKFKAFHDELMARYTEILSGEHPVLCRMKELWVYMHEYMELSDPQLKAILKAKDLTDYRLALSRISFH